MQAGGDEAQGGRETWSRGSTVRDRGQAERARSQKPPSPRLTMQLQRLRVPTAAERQQNEGWAQPRQASWVHGGLPTLTPVSPCASTLPSLAAGQPRGLVALRGPSLHALLVLGGP